MKKQGFKKFISMMVTLCMLLSLMAVSMPVSAAATYLYDVDFDSNAGSTDVTWTNKASSGLAFAQYHDDLRPGKTVASDAIRNNSSLKLDTPDNNIGSMIIGQQTFDTVSLSGNTTWYEASFKFETAIPSISLSNGVCHMYWIGTDGSLKFGYKDAPYTYSDFTFGTDEWYHLVVAVDNADVFNGVCPRVYTWVNGKMLTTSGAEPSGALVWGAWPGNGEIVNTMTGIALSITSSNTAGTMWLDNFKVYNTPGVMSAAGYDPQSIFADAIASSSSLIVADDTIGVPTNATLAEVVSALSFEGNAFYYDGKTSVTDMNVSAVGKTMYIASTSSIGVKKYTFIDAGNIEIPELDITENYYDVDFEQTGDTDTNWTNKAGSGVFGSTTIGHWAPAGKLVDDAVKGSKVVNITSPVGYTTGQYGCVGTRTSGYSSFVSNRVVWHELSFKFNKFTRTYLCAGEYPFDITENGELYIGGIQGNATYPGALVEQLEEGRWYHLVLAFDNIDTFAGASGPEVRIYAWLNGEFIETNETAINGASVSRTAYPSLGMYYLTSTIGSNAVDYCIDDVKMYTTSQPVKADGELCFTPEKKIAGAYITSDSLRVEDDVIYIPETMTVADAVAAIECDNEYSLFDGTTAVDKASTESAIGKTVYSQSNNNIGVLKYTFAKGSASDFAVTTASLKVNGVEASVADIKADDMVVASVNVTATTNSGVVVFAIYDGDSLVACSIKSVAEAATKTITSSEMKAETADDISVYAFLWDNMNSIKPLTDSFAY